MALYKYTTKAGQFYGVRFRVVEADGVERHKNLRGFTTQRAARQAQYEYERENSAHKKKRPATEPADNPIVAELYERYLPYAKTAIAPASLYDLDKVMQTIILPAFGARKIASLTKKELSDWQDSFPAEWSYSYKQKMRSWLSVLYNYAVEKEIVTENVMRKVKNIPRPNAAPTVDFWTLDEFRRFFAAIENARWQAFFLFLYLSGCRKGEAIALQWEDVDFARQEVNICKTRGYAATTAQQKFGVSPKTGTKNLKNGKIYMPRKMFELLAALPRQRYVFGNPDGTPATPTTIDRLFRQYAAAAGVKKIRVHDLRHSCASLIISQSDSELTALYAVAARLRDTPEQILKTYGHLFPSRQRELNKKLDELFD